MCVHARAHTCMLKGLQNNEHTGHPPWEDKTLCHRTTSISENYILKMGGKFQALEIKNSCECWKLGSLSQHSAQLSPQAGGCSFQESCNTQDLCKMSLPQEVSWGSKSVSEHRGAVIHIIWKSAGAKYNSFPRRVSVGNTKHKSLCSLNPAVPCSWTLSFYVWIQ